LNKTDVTTKYEKGFLRKLSEGQNKELGPCQTCPQQYFSSKPMDSLKKLSEPQLIEFQLLEGSIILAINEGEIVEKGNYHT